VKGAIDVGVVGCGFAGAATGLAVLARLGLVDEVHERGAPVSSLNCRAANGRTLFDIHYEQIAPGVHGLGIHRGALFEALLAAVKGAGVRISTGVEIVAVDRTGARPRVHDANGPLAPHDLLVVADGARSHLRDCSPALCGARPYRWGALWFVGADPERRFGTTLSQVCLGTRRMLGFLPTGLGPRGGAVPLVSMFWSLRMDRIDEWRCAGLAPWKGEILTLEPRADALLEQIHDADQILTAGYVDGVMHRFSDGCVAFVGDAAHATSPQLGQGANLALVDAAVLADSLAQSSSIGAALAAYSRARTRHIDHYQRMTRLLTPLFQSDSRALGILRDVTFPLANAIGPFRREMIRTMCGVSRGFLRRALNVSSPA
jgi:2-polyprenyl-6-methoxyphenol hydroxylase-like FAD-dependent oxidoreductase